MARVIGFLFALFVSPALASDDATDSILIREDVARAMYQQLHDQQARIGELSDTIIEQRRHINALQASNNCV